VNPLKRAGRRFSEPSRLGCAPHLILTWEFDTTYLLLSTIPLIIPKNAKF